MSQKERKTLLLARTETTPTVDSILANLHAATPPVATDALLCWNFDVQTNADTLQRQNYSPSLSPDVSEVGRVLGQMTFTTELRGSGTFGTKPRIGRLLKACGMSETLIPENDASAQIGDPVALPTNSSDAIAFIIDNLTKTDYPTSRYDRYKVTFTTGGASGTAEYVVTGHGYPDGDSAVLADTEHKAWHSSLLGAIAVGGTIEAPTFTFSGTWAELDMIEIFVGGLRFYHQVPQGGTATTAIATAVASLIDADARLTGTPSSSVITVGLAGSADVITTTASATQAVALGSSNAEVTLPDFDGEGSVIAGEGFEVILRRPGYRYDPVSDSFSTVSLWAYTDGTLYRIRGSLGTFTAQGNAAQFGEINWTFTGIYTDPVDASIPAGVVYETSKPYKIELAELALSGLTTAQARASRFSFDIGNTVTPNDNINADEATDGIEITARSATAGCDPEATAPSVFSPWSRMRRGDTSRIGITVGRRGGRGNQIRVQADRAGYTGAPFTNRNGIRVNDLGFQLGRVSGNGDDEMHITFY